MALAAISFSFVACSDGDDDSGTSDPNGNGSTVTYTVTYETAQGTAPEAISVTSGSALTAAQLPTLAADGYTFVGWYNGETEATTSTVVTSNITLTAKWTYTPLAAYAGRTYVWTGKTQQSGADMTQYITILDADTVIYQHIIDTPNIPATVKAPHTIANCTVTPVAKTENAYEITGTEDTTEYKFKLTFTETGLNFDLWNAQSSAYTSYENFTIYEPLKDLYKLPYSGKGVSNPNTVLNMRVVDGKTVEFGHGSYGNGTYYYKLVKTTVDDADAYQTTWYSDADLTTATGNVVTFSAIDITNGTFTANIVNSNTHAGGASAGTDYAFSIVTYNIEDLYGRTFVWVGKTKQGSDMTQYITVTDAQNVSWEMISGTYPHAFDFSNCTVTKTATDVYTVTGSYTAVGNTNTGTMVFTLTGKDTFSWNWSNTDYDGFAVYEPLKDLYGVAYSASGVNNPNVALNLKVVDAKTVEFGHGSYGNGTYYYKLVKTTVTAGEGDAAVAYKTVWYKDAGFAEASGNVVTYSAIDATADTFTANISSSATHEGGANSGTDYSFTKANN